MKRPHYIALGLIALLALAILNLPDRASARLKAGISSLFLPLLGLANSSEQLADEALDQLTPRRELLRQNQELRRERDQLLQRARQADALERENAQLRQRLGWQQQQPHKVRLAQVVLREPSNWWRAVQIDLGSRDQITNNLSVLSAEGCLVGRIAAVSLTRSQVVLVGDPNCHVAAVVENETHDTGVIGTSTPLNGGFVQLGYLSQTANLRPGQRVKTSGLGGIFPPGIPIGQIVDSEPTADGFGRVARVRLAANLDALEEVWVLWP